MSSVLQSMKNTVSGASSSVYSWVQTMNAMENNILVAIALVVLLGVCVYLYVMYLQALAKADELNDHIMQVRKLGRVYSASHYDPIIFEKLLLDALDELGKYVDVVAAPYFYSKPLDEILKVFPSYLVVMRFAKYVHEHDDTRNDAIHKTLVKTYGKRYKTSPKLTYEVTVDINKHRKSTYRHSILVDLTKGQFVYRKNKTKVNAMLAQVDQEKRK